MKKIFFILGSSLCLTLILSGCQYFSVKKPATEPTKITPPIEAVDNSDANAEQAIGMANPASQNCVDKGGRIEMRENNKGQYGVCLFEDNRQCEEWALFRNECPVGGLKITGYENEAQIFCAITGGKVEGVGTETPMCKRIDGTYCNAQANLDGECPDPHDPNPNAGNVETP